MSRAAEVAAGLAATRDRVAAACAAAGRDPGDVAIIAVTKTSPVSDVRLLAALGVRDIGESRDQEASTKAAETADLGLRWHIVGQVQTNKAGSVARYAHAVHSVDRARLVHALSRGAVAAERPVEVFVQVLLGDATGALGRRGGVAPAAAPALAELVSGAEGLRLAGVMAVAPLGTDPGRAFAELARTAERIRADHPEATAVSAGMSGDLEAAVAAGATHLRIGTAILGTRPSPG